MDKNTKDSNELIKDKPSISTDNKEEPSKESVNKSEDQKQKETDKSITKDNKDPK